MTRFSNGLPSFSVTWFSKQFSSLGRCLIALSLCLPASFSLGANASAGAPLDVVWPTPNAAMMEGRGLATYVQPTASGRLESALWGCVRNGGHRFHEGLDLKPLQRDSRGEATDPVFAAMPGQVVHINTVSGHSSYGRYIVMEHSGLHPGVYTLYAHLAAVEPGLATGQFLKAGERIATMGRSAGGYTIPRSRAHLHFEIGVRLSDSFQDWYDNQGFGSENHHGSYNGMNLIGFNPLDYYQKLMNGSVAGPASYLDQEPTAVSLRVFTSEVPDFLKRYPALIAGGLKKEPHIAWDIEFTWYGLPKAWIPRYPEDGLSGSRGTLQLLSLKRELLESQHCKNLLEFPSPDRVTLGQDLRNLLEILFEVY